MAWFPWELKQVSNKDLSQVGVGCWIKLGLVNIKVDRCWNLSDALHKYSIEYIDGLIELAMG